MSEEVLLAVFTFPSLHHALRAEKLCLEAGLRARLIPLPREISSDCGVVLALPWEARAAGEEVLAGAGVPVAGLHSLRRSGRQARFWRS